MWRPRVVCMLSVTPLGGVHALCDAPGGRACSLWRPWVACMLSVTPLGGVHALCDAPGWHTCSLWRALGGVHPLWEKHVSEAKIQRSTDADAVANTRAQIKTRVCGCEYQFIKTRVCGCEYQGIKSRVANLRSWRPCGCSWEYFECFCI